LFSRFSPEHGESLRTPPSGGSDQGENAP
jgi:hypothetical protein